MLLCGDGQFDYPGFSAKFCTYTIIDCTNDKVVDTLIIQKGQYVGYTLVQWDRKTVIHRQFKDLRGKKPYPTLPLLSNKCWHLSITKDDARKNKWFNIDEGDFKSLF